MIKEMLYLQDGTFMDFRGKQIFYGNQCGKKDLTMPILPYSRQEIEVDKTPVKFLDYVSGFVGDSKTAETLLYFLSLIPSGNTCFGYWLFLHGHAATGKTVFLQLLDEIFSPATIHVERTLFFYEKKSKAKKLHPLLEEANEKLLALSDDTTNSNFDCILNTEALESVLSDKKTCFYYGRGFNTIRPSAQYIFSSNYSFCCLKNAPEKVFSKLIYIYLEKQIPQDKRKSSESIIAELRPEFPIIIKFLINRYIYLRDELHGIIPIANEHKVNKDFFTEFTEGANK